MTNNNKELIEALGQLAQYRDMFNYQYKGQTIAQICKKAKVELQKYEAMEERLDDIEELRSIIVDADEGYKTDYDGIAKAIQQYVRGDE